MTGHFSKVTTMEELKTLYKKLAFIYHPDRGGSVEEMSELNKEYEEAKKRIESGYYDRYSECDDEYNEEYKEEKTQYSSWEGFHNPFATFSHEEDSNMKNNSVINDLYDDIDKKLRDANFNTFFNIDYIFGDSDSYNILFIYKKNITINDDNSINIKIHIANKNVFNHKFKKAFRSEYDRINNKFGQRDLWDEPIDITNEMSKYFKSWFVEREQLLFGLIKNSVNKVVGKDKFKDIIVTFNI